MALRYRAAVLHGAQTPLSIETVTAASLRPADVLVRITDFEEAVTAKHAEGFTETERSLTRRVFTAADRHWIISLDGDTVRTLAGPVRADWREASGHARDKEFRDRDRAVAAYHRAIADKQAEGYGERYARAVVIADTPTGPKKTGKKKAR